MSTFMIQHQFVIVPLSSIAAIILGVKLGMTLEMGAAMFVGFIIIHRIFEIYLFGAAHKLTGHVLETMALSDQ